jgi:hypothetical protein
VRGNPKSGYPAESTQGPTHPVGLGLHRRAIWAPWIRKARGHRVLAIPFTVAEDEIADASGVVTVSDGARLPEHISFAAPASDGGVRLAQGTRFLF